MKITTGAVIETPGSTTANKTGGWRTFKPVRNKECCIKCGLCWVYCPDNAINQEFDANLDYCKGCGICASICPKTCIHMEKEEK
jgi:pyruvate ferredoxin oxidoreductase delta subunit